METFPLTVWKHLWASQAFMSTGDSSWQWQVSEFKFYQHQLWKNVADLYFRTTCGWAHKDRNVMAWSCTSMKLTLQRTHLTNCASAWKKFIIDHWHIVVQVICVSPHGRVAEEASFFLTSQQYQCKYMRLLHNNLLWFRGHWAVYFKLHPYAQGEGIGGNSGNVMAAMK